MLRVGDKLVLATANPGKKKEIQALLDGSGVELVSLVDYPQLILPEESGATFTENAGIKARFVAETTGRWALSDDSGLVVEALDGAPGVHSARYAGPQASDLDNNLKLLEALAGVAENRRGAAFFCVMVLAAPDGREFVFEGCCRGRIGYRLSGAQGFGYDPLFMVEPDYRLSMAQLTPTEKGRISHRGRALRQMQQWLEGRKKG
ncbi:MAG: RdgB/HAM1 family non-canonical purine NTP pyrophosphatase [Deltaproteobacteria bacterium]|nr:RdgB/HAM1 family non-canonical purine NTP pyrophosphatase [Deltaproteobacteria bacterium]